MLSNIGRIDRLIRTVLAFVMVFGSIYFGRWWAVPGVVILLTTIIGWRPIYAVFRLTTTKDQIEIPPDTSGEHKPQHGPRRFLK